jgi:parallel beta-helix repeat protein
MKGKSLVTLGLAALLLSIAAPAAADGNMIVVDNDGVECPNPDSNTIQGGVDMAAPGDTVFVCAGVYFENTDPGPHGVVISGPAKNNIRVIGADVDEVIVDGTNNPLLMHGFHLENVSGVELRHLSVRRWHDDIWLENADGNRIRDNRASEAWGHDGIVMATDSDGNTVERNVSFNHTNPIGCGISAGGGSGDNVIRDNLTFGNVNAGILQGGLLGPAGPGNRIVHNVSRNNPGQGILIANSANARVDHNDVHDNGQNGILLTGPVTTGTVIEHNEVVHNGSTNVNDGIRLQNGASNNVVRHNESRLNRHDGVHLTATAGNPGASNNLVEHNRLADNGTPGAGNGCGVDVDSGSANNTVRHNHAEGHDNSGIRVLNAGTGNVVAHNNVSDNGQNGILNQNTAGTLIEHNKANRNVGFGAAFGRGIHTTMSANLTVRRNQANSNSDDGIVLGTVQNSLVSENHADSNGRDGIRSGSNSSGNVFARNHMRHNGEFDADDMNRPANTWTDNHCDTDNPPGTIC